MQFWRGVFERRAPHSILGVEVAIGAELRQGNSTRDISAELLDTLTGTYREAAGRGEPA